MGRFADFLPRKDNTTGRWCISVPGRLSPTGKRKRKYFKTKGEAESYGADLIKLEKENAQLIKKLDVKLIESAVHFNEVFQLYGFKGFPEACNAFLKRLEKESKSVSFGELLEAYEKENQANWGDRHLQVWKTVKSLVENHLASPLSLLDKPFWIEWMEEHRVSRKWSDRSYNDFLSRFSSIWKYALDNELVQKNPIETIPRRRLKTKPVAILSTSQVEEILLTAWNHDREMTPYFAIGIFAGLRPNSELESLDWSDVNFEESWIRVDFGNKTDTKRFVPMEVNLKRWLEPWSEAQGLVTPSNYVKRRRYIVRGKYQSPPGSSEAKWSEIASWAQRDIMRHSYGSYLDGLYRDRNLVKETMGHTNFRTYDQHYRRAVSPEEAAAFWGIVPPTDEG